MRAQCPECGTVTGGDAKFCGSCFYRFGTLEKDQMRAKRSRVELAVAIAAGLTIAVVRYVLQS
jgi:predicted nucleic acid-binding Zn ribbon protein